MTRLHRTRRWLARSAGIAVATAAVSVTAALPADASSHEQIQGSGSSWAFNAVNQWVSDVTQQGLKVVYTPSGSAQGRTDFAQGVVDYAVSDIGYQGNAPGSQGDFSNRQYDYLPIVGGGTAFPYNLVVGGQRVQNLRLSGLTLAKIFCDQITNWDDPAISADNNGRVFPSIPIIPVVHSEGAGTTYQFTDWLYNEYPAQWESFTKDATGTAYNYATEFWPTGAGSQSDQNGSDGVMSFIQSAAGQGSIGFDEYSYAVLGGDPVVALENKAGWYTLPDAYNVAVSLTQAVIDPKTLLETLNNVWNYTDPRTYPLSSYTYMIEPTGPSDPTVTTTPKAQTIADFVDYSICQGQAEMAPIGYSPLPVNLVEASEQRVDDLHRANAAVDVSNANPADCHNPTFVAGNPNANYLAQIAPLPPACAKAGAGPCSGQYAHNGNPVAGKASGTSAPGLPAPGGKVPQAAAPGASRAAGGTSAVGNSTAGGGSTGSGTAGGGTSIGASGSSTTGSGSSAAPGSGGIQPSSSVTGASGGTTETGGAAAASDSGANGATSQAALVAGVPTDVPTDRPSSDGWGALVDVAALIVLGTALIVPPVLIRRRPPL